MADNITVKDCMSKVPPHVVTGTPVVDVIEKLNTFRIGGIPVINEAREVIGFVSEHDCISKILQSSYYCEPNALVNEVMTTTPDMVKPNDSIIELAEKMLTSRRQVFPVIDNGKLCGIITRSMVLVALKDKLKDCKNVF
jgi:CBS domain-containing protein